MATIPQQLIAIAEAAKKAGAKTGKQTWEYTGKHAPKLVSDHVSHLFLAHKMVHKPEQFGPAIEAVKKGASGTLAAIAKPYQKAPTPRGTAQPAKAPSATPARTPKGDPLAARLRAALGLDEPQATEAPTRRRAFKPPTINPKVYDDFADMVEKKAKGSK